MKTFDVGTPMEPNYDEIKAHIAYSKRTGNNAAVTFYQGRLREYAISELHDYEDLKVLKEHYKELEAAGALRPTLDHLKGRIAVLEDKK